MGICMSQSGDSAAMQKSVEGINTAVHENNTSALTKMLDEVNHQPGNMPCVNPYTVRANLSPDAQAATKVGSDAEGRRALVMSNPYETSKK